MYLVSVRRGGVVEGLNHDLRVEQTITVTDQERLAIGQGVGKFPHNLPEHSAKGLIEIAKEIKGDRLLDDCGGDTRFKHLVLAVYNGEIVRTQTLLQFAIHYLAG
jgi:hypothetical protein